jgi:hypothetical protein
MSPNFSFGTQIWGKTNQATCFAGVESGRFEIPARGGRAWLDATEPGRYGLVQVTLLDAGGVELARTLPYYHVPAGGGPLAGAGGGMWGYCDPTYHARPHNLLVLHGTSRYELRGLEAEVDAKAAPGVPNAPEPAAPEPAAPEPAAPEPAPALASVLKTLPR